MKAMFGFNDQQFNDNVTTNSKLIMAITALLITRFESS